MPRKANKISTRWIRENREAFRDFLDETNLPDPERLGERGPKFKYPEWLIMFIAILSVKLKVKSYVQIQKMAVKYWDNHRKRHHRPNHIPNDQNAQPLNARIDGPWRDARR